MELMYPFTITVTLLALVVYQWTTFNAGMARGKYNVPAPATDGPPEYLRRYRAHQNMLENMACFLPAMWIFAVVVSDVWAAGIGLLWCIARVIYALGYYAQAEKRMIGFGIAFLCVVTLILGSLVAIVIAHF